MCLGIPGRIVELVDAAQNLARVEVSGVRRVISVSLVAGQRPKAGDWVLVHVGFAMAMIDETEAAQTLAAMQKLGQPYVDELEAFDSTAIV
jgi:hydrogenase expression/formation protein HypC